ncbi:MAG: hypothetical protein WC967_00635 [Balneolaceae bacterium]
MNKTIYLVITTLILSIGVLFYKLDSANTSFETYIYESRNPSTIHECLKVNCFTNTFMQSGKINTKRIVIVKPKNSCTECNEMFSRELEPILSAINGWEVIVKTDDELESVLVENHFQFEHVTLIALDRYTTHYVYEYHPTFPLKNAKTDALLTFLEESVK